MQTAFDTKGRAYGHAKPSHDPVLVEVGPGTPGGELLRRYWHPIAHSADATDLPKEITRFGEKLILFRNKKGEAGLLYPRCIHRGTSLLYGRVEEDGIRCCYHGWKFSTEGKCLDQPCEPKGGVAKHNYRQPWYPILEKWGAIWTYMGPPEKQPLFPEYSHFQNLGADEEIVANPRDEAGVFGPSVMDYNWFQFWENAADTFHVPILHHAISGDQFKQTRLGIMPKINVFYNKQGNSVVSDNIRVVDEGEEYIYRGTVQAIMPNAMALPPFFGGGVSKDLTFMVPVDDTNFVLIGFTRQKKSGPAMPDFDFRQIGGIGPEMKLWGELTPQERQRFPSDYEAQASQGKITTHSEEHLVTSDKGVALLRKLYRENCEKVARGEDPVGVGFKPADNMIEVVTRIWSETRDGKELPYVNDWPKGMKPPAEYGSVSHSGKPAA